MIESKIRAFALEFSQKVGYDLPSPVEEMIRGQIRTIVVVNTQAGVAELISLGVQEADAHAYLVNIDDIPQIFSDSGSFDFSKPRTPMLPWLLKNGKVAKDGSIYKRIPIGSGKNKETKKLSMGMEAMSEKGSLSSITEDIVSSFNVSTPVIVEKTSEEVRFKTASSKQDPTENWVLPSKDDNISFEVQNINAQIRVKILEDIEDTLNSWREDYGIRYA
jgi:hypothetical protein